MAERPRSKSGIEMFPGRGPGHGPAAHLVSEKPKVHDAKNAIRRLWNYMKADKPKLASVCFLVVFSTLETMLMPWFVSIAIDQYIIPGNVEGLLLPILGMAGLFVIMSAAGWLQQYLMIGISQKALGSLRRDLFCRLQELDLAYHDSHPHGELMSRFTNDVENINNVMAMTVTQFLSGIFAIIGVLGMMYVLNIYLAIVTTATVPLIFVITRMIGKRTRKGFREQQKLLGELNSHVEETITAQRVVMLFCREKQVVESFENINDQLKKVTIRSQALVGLMGPLMNLTNNFRYAIIAAAGGFLGINGLASIGIIAAFLSYTRQFGRPISEMAQLYNSILSALAGAERVFEVMDQKPMVISAPDAKPLVKVKGEVMFRNVYFSYIPGKPVLQDINLHVRPGQTVALVGPTGAGKTTIINLLTRFYDIQNGEIQIDGRNICEYLIDDLRRALGLVLQDTFLFSGSVADNIRYGNLSATDNQVREAARLSMADSFIHHLPSGYATELSEEGHSLSQGQKQLVAIARAILADPAILILDEATSSVDTRTEALIQEGMARLMKGRTSFVIAHRLSTIRNADNILVISDGRIVEQGNHDELLGRNGFYARLHNSHFETEIR
ncbi:MAG: ABC transporter ATP-binding protein [Spirochaetaceae bacterium]|nr:MAG: ABC transporter ATP-binding protein [Spirochaetaceae bacterium]